MTMTTVKAIDGEEENQNADAAALDLLLRRLSELEASGSSGARLRAREASERELEELAKGLPLAALAAGKNNGSGALPLPGLVCLRRASGSPSSCFSSSLSSSSSSGTASLRLLESPGLSVPVPPAEWGLLASWREKKTRARGGGKEEEDEGSERGGPLASSSASSAAAAAAFFAPLGRRDNKRLEFAVPGKGMRSAELDVFLVCGAGNGGRRRRRRRSEEREKDNDDRNGDGGGGREQQQPPPLLYLGTLSPDALSAVLDAGEAEDDDDDDDEDDENDGGDCEGTAGANMRKWGVLSVRAVVAKSPFSSSTSSCLAAALLSSLLAAGSAPPPNTGAGGPTTWSRGKENDESSCAGMRLAVLPGRRRASLRLDALSPSPSTLSSSSSSPAAAAAAAAAIEVTLSGDVADLAALHSAVRKRLEALSGLGSSSLPSSSSSFPPPLPFAAASQAALEASLAALRGLRGAAVALEDEARALASEAERNGRNGRNSDDKGDDGANTKTKNASYSSLQQRLRAARGALADAFVALRGATGAVPAACL